MNTLLSGDNLFDPILIDNQQDHTPPPLSEDKDESCTECGGKNKPVVLLKENYLSEFTLDSEKKRARENLDIKEPTWGDIQGDIDKLLDLKRVLDKYKKQINIWKGDLTPPEDYDLWFKTNGAVYIQISGVWSKINIEDLPKKYEGLMQTILSYKEQLNKTQEDLERLKNSGSVIDVEKTSDNRIHFVGTNVYIGDTTTIGNVNFSDTTNVSGVIKTEEITSHYNGSVIWENDVASKEDIDSLILNILK